MGAARGALSEHSLMKYSKFILIILTAVFIQACSDTGPAKKKLANQAIDPAGLYTYQGFHQVMASHGGTTIHIAGQVPYDENMNLIGAGDYRAQATRTFENLATAVTAAGGKPSDIVSSVFYVKALDTPGAAEDISAAMAVALDGQPFPAHAFSIIGVETLADPRLLIEISAVAVID